MPAKDARIAVACWTGSGKCNRCRLTTQRLGASDVFLRHWNCSVPSCSQAMTQTCPRHKEEAHSHPLRHERLTAASVETAQSITQHSQSSHGHGGVASVTHWLGCARGHRNPGQLSPPADDSKNVLLPRLSRRWQSRRICKMSRSPTSTCLGARVAARRFNPSRNFNRCLQELDSCLSLRSFLAGLVHCHSLPAAGL